MARSTWAIAWCHAMFNECGSNQETFGTARIDFIKVRSEGGLKGCRMSVPC